MSKEQLQNIGRQIVHAKTVDEELASAKLYSDFLSSFSIHPDETLQKNFNTEIKLEGGFALSPLHAVRCVKEYTRTARFIRGTWLAINELINRFPGQKINILYAGCGPYATILLPLLPLLREDQIDITLLDIHEYSTTSASHIISELGLEAYISKVILGDAITYQHPPAFPLHLVVTETMYRALLREPQTSITANLAPQLIKNGILIPEEISVDLVYSFFAYEPVLNPDVDERPNQVDPEIVSNRIKQDTLFSMNKEDNFSELYHQSLPFETGWIKPPQQFENCPDICLFTTVSVFDGIKLELAESTITNPYCVHSLFNLSGDDSCFKLSYHFKDVPEWSIQIRNNS
jgi:hypothetical protein